MNLLFRGSQLSRSFQTCLKVSNLRTSNCIINNPVNTSLLLNTSSFATSKNNTYNINNTTQFNSTHFVTIPTYKSAQLPLFSNFSRYYSTEDKNPFDFDEDDFNSDMSADDNEDDNEFDFDRDTFIDINKVAQDKDYESKDKYGITIDDFAYKEGESMFEEHTIEKENEMFAKEIKPSEHDIATHRSTYSQSSDVDYLEFEKVANMIPNPLINDDPIALVRPPLRREDSPKEHDNRDIFFHNLVSSAGGQQEIVDETDLKLHTYSNRIITFNLWQEKEIFRKPENEDDAGMDDDDDDDDMPRVLDNHIIHEQHNDDESGVNDLLYMPREDDLTMQYDRRYILRVRRHTKVTKGGRVMSYSAFVIIGNGKGSAGVGFGKDEFPDSATDKALDDAYNNIVTIDRLEDRTVSRYTKGRYRNSFCIVIPKGPDSRTRACPKVQHILDCFGIQDVTVKLFGSRNIISQTKALMVAFMQSESLNTQAIKRGKRVFDFNRIWRANHIEQQY